MKTGFIGAGKVGFSLGKYFVENGVEVSGYYSRSPSSSKEASVFTGTRYFENVQDLVEQSDILFVTVPDDEIYNIWMKLKEFNLREKIICHASGSLSSNIFSDSKKSDVYAYSIHPLLPISNKYESYESLKNAWFTIEGHEKYLKKLTDIFKAVGNNIITMEKEDKALYHLAAVTVSNLFCGLMNRACGYMQEYGFEEQEAVEALYPLILSNINNIRNAGIIKALTGPVERGDIKTLYKHFSIIPEEHKIVYRDLSMELLDLAKRKNTKRDYSEIEQYLEGLK